MTTSAARHAQSVTVFRAEDLRVESGVNLGEPVSFADELHPGDSYALAPAARRYRLSLETDETGALAIAPDSAIGRAGTALHLDCCLVFMAATGATTELLVLVAVDGAGHVDAVYVLPLAPLRPRVGYLLVGIDRDSAAPRLAELAAVSFARGTHITLASGAQRRIEALRVGDRVLTRDDGAQRIRWIGQTTLRALGAFAPIRIAAGALHNARDLRVSPDHRLFVYQRGDTLGAGRSEVLVRARHLVNGDTVIREEGGFVDYFQLLFDAHQIIYAEGIAAETLLVDPRTRPALPADLSGLAARDPVGHAPRPHLRFEIGEGHLQHPDMAAFLRGASTR